MIHRFILNEVSYFGPGSRSEIVNELGRMAAKKAMVVTDPGLMLWEMIWQIRPLKWWLLPYHPR